MFEYNVKIKKVSGRLNESVLPKKNLVVKSKSELSMRNILQKAAKYLLENYGLELSDADITEVSSDTNRKSNLQNKVFTPEEVNVLLNGVDFQGFNGVGEDYYHAILNDAVKFSDDLPESKERIRKVFSQKNLRTLLTDFVRFTRLAIKNDKNQAVSVFQDALLDLEELVK